ncbi:hypothetical protein IV37_GL000162 [Fructilactobacillus fructivorans]|uniref:putative HNHc nuclease n=1 Tax=Fructilactobacillus fructivorans TaxID=1614 RepID=UPI000705293E|nr:putative HNHc nuclease [Fructilactobacillus fructivorans]KRN13441.1 hypothetical protein IV37_GL000162 [Fructilactobacillus fructivorans]
MYAKLEHINGSQLVLDVNEQLDMEKIKRFSDGHQPIVEIDIADGRHITPDQRKKIFGLIGDFSEYTGFLKPESEAFLKYEFIETMKEPQYFSMANCSVTLAKQFIDFIIGYFIDEDVPFKTKCFDEIQGNYGLVRKCVLHRDCIVCGKPGADIDHFKAVGMGRNRYKIDQRGMYVWSLCRKHHQERHQIGITDFAKKYQIKPIKLDDELIRQLGLTSNKRLDEQEKNDEPL